MPRLGQDRRSADGTASHIGVTLPESGRGLRPATAWMQLGRRIEALPTLVWPCLKVGGGSVPRPIEPRECMRYIRPTFCGSRSTTVLPQHHTSEICHVENCRLLRPRLHRDRLCVSALHPGGHPVARRRGHPSSDRGGPLSNSSDKPCRRSGAERPGRRLAPAD